MSWHPSVSHGIHFTCFNCRKMFRKGKYFFGRNLTAKCPQCGQPMHNMGLNFKAPKQKDLKGWQVAQILFAHNIHFGVGGCSHGPKRLQEVPAFLREVSPPSPGQLFLERVPRTRSKTKSKL